MDKFALGQNNEYAKSSESLVGGTRFELATSTMSIPRNALHLALCLGLPLMIFPVFTPLWLLYAHLIALGQRNDSKRYLQPIVICCDNCNFVFSSLSGVTHDSTDFST